MTVGELMETLQSFPMNRELAVSPDGKSYGPVLGLLDRKTKDHQDTSPLIIVGQIEIHDARLPH